MVISEKMLKDFLLFQYTDNLHFDWAKLVVDAHEKYEHSKELLLLMNKCLKTLNYGIHCKRKIKKDGGNSRNRIQKNIKNTWRKKIKGIKRGKKSAN